MVEIPQFPFNRNRRNVFQSHLFLDGLVKQKAVKVQMMAFHNFDLGFLPQTLKGQNQGNRVVLDHHNELISEFLRFVGQSPDPNFLRDIIGFNVKGFRLDEKHIFGIFRVLFDTAH